jgi:purine nucleoside phosphorylase
MGLYEQVQETARTIRDRAGSLSPRVGIILGSGLVDFAGGFEHKAVTSYTVAHAGASKA